MGFPLLNIRSTMMMFAVWVVIRSHLNVLVEMQVHNRERDILVLVCETLSSTAGIGETFELSCRLVILV